MEALNRPSQAKTTRTAQVISSSSRPLRLSRLRNANNTRNNLIIIIIVIIRRRLRPLSTTIAIVIIIIITIDLRTITTHRRRRQWMAMKNRDKRPDQL